MWNHSLPISLCHMWWEVMMDQEPYDMQQHSTVPPNMWWKAIYSYLCVTNVTPPIIWSVSYTPYSSSKGPKPTIESPIIPLKRGEKTIWYWKYCRFNSFGIGSVVTTICGDNFKAFLAALRSSATHFWFHFYSVMAWGVTLELRRGKPIYAFVQRR